MGDKHGFCRQFLDELPEFGTRSLETLRQPLEDRIVTISRASGSLTFPANFVLIAAMYPCPCGCFGDERKQCTCSLSMIQRDQIATGAASPARSWTAWRVAPVARTTST